MRPWEVKIVRCRSMGGRRRGDGPTEVVAQWSILPTPKIGDMSGVKQLITPDQLRETGTMIVTEISNAYTEDMLMGRGPAGGNVGRDEVVFYEVAWIDGDGCVGEARRFVLDGAPTYIPESAQWQVTLMRAHDDRDRNGTPR